MNQRDSKLVTDLDALARMEEADAWDRQDGIRAALYFCIDNVMPLDERLDILKRSLLNGEMSEDRRRWLATICDNIQRRLRIASTVDNMVFDALYPEERRRR